MKQPPIKFRIEIVENGLLLDIFMPEYNPTPSERYVFQEVDGINEFIKARIKAIQDGSLEKAL
jgi:hypothetical protein